MPHSLEWLLPDKTYKLISALLIVNFPVLGSTESLLSATTSGVSGRHC